MSLPRGTPREIATQAQCYRPAHRRHIPSGGGRANHPPPGSQSRPTISGN